MLKGNHNNWLKTGANGESLCVKRPSPFGGSAHFGVHAPFWRSPSAVIPTWQLYP